MNNDEMREKIKDIFFEVFPNLSENDFLWEKEQKDYENWDSFAQLHLIALAESKFNIEISLDDSINFTSAKDLLECVKSLL